VRKIRVLVVEDSLVFRQILVEKLNQDSGIEVVAAARDPFEARDMILQYKPDVMTLDIELPRMDGIEFLRKLMPQYPLPVVMISSRSERVFDAMEAGAVDFVEKPANATREDIENFVSNELPVKIKIASVAKVRRRRPLGMSADSELYNSGKRCKLIAIGASTGGTEATAELFQNLREDLPGIVIVQHMPAGFTELYARRLNESSRVEVREAKSGDVVKPGLALLAPGGEQQMTLVKVGDEIKVMLRKAPKVNGHCPSVDVLFHSVADTIGGEALGVILTGMGGDGAKGLLDMRQKGAHTIGQDESTSVVYGMPKVAYDSGAVEYQERLPDISKRIYTILNRN
jgi:two-component system chemotaxis response regulator CheB